MRIVGGKYRHRIIEMTNLETTRETQDKVREAIFNSIGPYFDGGIALDLFAGSGAMGIEAYSRGINHIYLNDLENKALNICKKNCKALGITDVTFTNMDYSNFVKNINIKFDLIILDPPYKMNNIDDILLAIEPIANDNAIIVFEMANDSEYSENIGSLYLKKEKKYGIKKVAVFLKWMI